MKPMLAHTLRLDPDFYINDERWHAEQKLDGKRLIVEVKDREPTAYNRQGNVISIPTQLAADFDRKAFEGRRWIFDGELVGDTYFLFDCVRAGDELNESSPSEQRFGFLRQLLPRWKPVNIELTPHAETVEDKQRLYDLCKENFAEGLIFKHKRGNYLSGIRTLMMLKHKFVETCDVVVTELNHGGKERSIGIGLYAYEELIEVAGCKIPDELIGKIKPGDVIEVNYLYATEKTNRLYQPVFYRTREDKSPFECNIQQLKYGNKNVIQLDNLHS